MAEKLLSAAEVERILGNAIIFKEKIAADAANDSNYAARDRKIREVNRLKNILGDIRDLPDATPSPGERLEATLALLLLAAEPMESTSFALESACEAARAELGFTPPSAALQTEEKQGGHL